jgi:hypothetical protein
MQTWQPMIGDEVIQGWQVEAKESWQAKDMIEAAMEKKGVWGTKIKWINGGRKVSPVNVVMAMPTKAA